MCYAVSQPDDFVADELCFVPQGDRCDILSIRTNGWERHHGDHRREPRRDPQQPRRRRRLRQAPHPRRATKSRARRRWAASVADFEIADTSDLQRAREAVDEVLQQAGLDDINRQRTILCISEAVTNMLLHGGGHGAMRVRRLDDRLRFVVADEGPGLNFLNWIEPPAKGGQASMGYGYKIILDYLDAVGLHTGPGGTTLLLDRLTN